MLMKPPIRVLLVDDELTIRTSLGEYLSDRNFEVFSDVSAEDALQTIGKTKVDVAIVDIRLPGIDGNSLILKAHELDRSLRFLIYTGSTDYQVPPSLSEIGIRADHVFKKPLSDLIRLVAAIECEIN